MSAVATEEHIIIPTARGRLAGILAYPDEAPRGAVLVCNAHPLMGGSMTNNVTRAIGAGLADAGFATLRFDYAGVGESDGERLDVSGAMATFWTTGQTESDPEMLDDAFAARLWMQQCTGLHCAIVGYSFGAWIATEISDDETPALCLLAPTIEKHDFSTALGDRAPLLVVVCSDDFTTKSVEPSAYFEGRHAPTRLVQIDTDHFFRKREAEIVRACAAFLSEEASQ